MNHIIRIQQITFDDSLDDMLGAEGARVLSETLKHNTTLKSLNLSCKEEGKRVNKENNRIMVTVRQGITLELKGQKQCVKC